MSDNNTDPISSDVEFQQQALSTSEAYKERDLLVYLRVEKELSLEAIADKFNRFGYDVGKSTIGDYCTQFDLPDPNNQPSYEGDNEGTEPAQPSSSRIEINRNSESPVHPLDTDCFEKPDDSPSETWGDILPMLPRLPDDDPRSEIAVSEKIDTRQPPLYKIQNEDPAHYRVDSEDRESSLFASPFTTPDLPEALWCCGCGNCEKRHVLDVDGSYAFDDVIHRGECPNPIPPTLAGARRIYRKFVGGRYNSGKGSKADDALEKYRKILLADRLFTNGSYVDDGDVTTVLLSLRVKTLDWKDRLIAPHDVAETVSMAWKTARKEYRTVLQNVNQGKTRSVPYVWTVTGTDEWATPHVHAYAWLQDPENEITSTDFAPVVNMFEKYTRRLVDDDTNPIDPRGKDGAVRVEHSPLLVDPANLNWKSVEKLQRIPEYRQTRGAVYLATQLPHLAVVGQETDADIEAGAWAWAIGMNSNTFSASQAVHNIVQSVNERENSA